MNDSGMDQRPRRAALAATLAVSRGGAGPVDAVLADLFADWVSAAAGCAAAAAALDQGAHRRGRLVLPGVAAAARFRADRFTRLAALGLGSASRRCQSSRSPSSHVAACVSVRSARVVGQAGFERHEFTSAARSTPRCQRGRGAGVTGLSSARRSGAWRPVPGECCQWWNLARWRCDECHRLSVR